jgi:hypothetical protein
MTHFVCFSHHKGASRLFRFQIFQPLAERLGREVIRYQALNPFFVFRETEDLELHNIRFDDIARQRDCVIILGNSGPRVVRAIKTAAEDYRGIHVVRDPRQMLVSGYFHHLDGHDIFWPGFYWEKLAEDRPRLARLDLEHGLLYELENIAADVLGQLEAWEDDDRVLNVRVEDLVRDPPATLARMLAFLGVEGDTGIDLRNLTANPDSRDWREVFTPRVADAFKARFGSLLVRYGYERDRNW